MQPQLQREMAAAIPGATVHDLAGGHLSCRRPEFGVPLLRACDDVADRIAAVA